MNSTPAFQTVIFDLDGTLCDTIALIEASFEHAHREVLGETVDPAVVRTWIGRTLVDIYAAWPEHQQELVDSYIRFNLAHLEELQTNYDGIPELLHDLVAAGLRIGVATSKRREAAVRSLKASGVDGTIDVLCAMEDTTEHKPSPEPLLKALAIAGGEPATSAYVGDALVDVQAAQAAGMAAVAVTWGAGDRTDLLLASPAAACDSVDDLRRVLLG